MIGRVDGQALGRAVRAIRLRRGWTQVELGLRAGVSPQTVSRLELGATATMRMELIDRVAGAVGVTVRLVPSWRGGELDRLVNRRHSLLHEAVARRFRTEWPGWQLVPEVSFSIYGERGIIDDLAWNPSTRELLVIELKTNLIDVNELIGTLIGSDVWRRRWRSGADGRRGWFRPG
jgi:transcriptional regulator with XRE-family HTH domain